MTVVSGWWKRAALVVALATFLLPVRSATAAPIAGAEYFETDLGGGLFRYDFTFVNASDPVLDAGTDLYDLTIFFPSIDLVSAVTPTGWDWIGGDGFVDAFSLQPGTPDAIPPGTDIGPGQQLAGFSFVTNSALGNAPFAATFTSLTDPENPVVFEGRTTSTRPEVPNTPVPEPSSVWLLGVGTASVLFARRRSALREPIVNRDSRTSLA